MAVRANKPAFNIREKLKELTHSIGLKGRELMRAATAQDARDLVSAGRKNLVINGRFRVDQRNEGSALTLQTGYTVDRFRVHGPNANNFIVDQQTKGVRVTHNASGVENWGHFGTPLEQQDLLPYLGKEMTVSFFVRSDVNTTSNLYITDTPSPTSGTALTITSVSYNITTSWQKITHTFTMPSSLSYASFYIGVLQIANVPVSSWVEIDEVQLEVGKNATDFEYRSYGEELALCQRYYWQPVLNGNNAEFTLLGISYTANSYYMPIHFPTTMRISPTVGGSGTWRSRTNNINSFSISGFSTHGSGSVHGTTVQTSGGSIAAATPFWFEVHADGTGNLFFDAEI